MQKVLCGEQVALLRGLAEEEQGQGYREEVALFLKQLNTQALNYEEDRVFVTLARDQVKGYAGLFSFDDDAEVFPVDASYAWVSGWALVKKGKR